MKKSRVGHWGMLCEEVPFYSCCREDFIGGRKLDDRLRFAVGCSASGFDVRSPYDYGHSYVGVCRLLREF